MALTKQQVSVNFSKGLDTKSDPWQVPIGNFLNLENSVFTKQGLLQKRNGFEQIGTFPTQNIKELSTLNGQLTLIGDGIYAYQDGGMIYNRGYYKPALVETKSIVKGFINCVQSDSSSSNGVTCVVYTEELAGPSYTYKYTIYNTETGQIIVSPTTLTGTGGNPNGSPRVIVHNNNFVIVYSVLVGAADQIQYTRIPVVSLVADAPVVISTDALYDTQGSFDLATGQGNLYVVWQSSLGTAGIYATVLDPTFAFPVPTLISTGTIVAEIVTCAFDTTTNNLSVCYYDSGTGGGTGPNLYLGIRSLTLSSVLNQTTIVAAPSPLISNVTLCSENGLNTVLYERINSYTYSPSVPTNYISKITVTTAGVVGTPSVFVRGNGLSSKLFYVDNMWYVSTTHQSELQDSYFVLNLDGNVVSKHAYGFGDGYITRGLPGVSVIENTARLSYLLKTSSLAGQSGSTETAGINVLSLKIGSVPVYTAEMSNTLNLSGGIQWSYDGLSVTENNFLLHPENVQVIGATSGTLTGNLVQTTTYSYTAIYFTIDNQGNQIQSAISPVIDYEVFATGATFTANETLGSNTITNVSSFTNVQVGQEINGGGFALATITAINTSTNTITLDVNSVSTATGATYTVATAVRRVNINIPTIRTTNRTQTGPSAQPILVEVYRTSSTQPGDHAVGGFLNDSTVDFITIQDLSNDAQIINNKLIYTSGGVLPNDSGPPSNYLTIFDNRLWVSDSEKEGTLWFSKIVIPGTPVEMSAFQTYYVNPAAGAQGYTGKITNLTPMDDKLVLFKEDSISYINGVGPDATGANSGYSEPIFITSTVGCKHPGSVTISPSGLMFQSDKGIWILGRDTSTNYIGFPVEKYTEEGSTIKALTIPNTNEVRFVLDSGITLMYDYFFQQWGSFTGIEATSAALYQQLHTYFDEFGRLFKEKRGSYVDGASPVLMKFKTNWFALSGIQGFQRAYFLFLLGEYYTPHKLTINVSYDFNPNATQQLVVTPDNYASVFGSSPVFGSSFGFGGPSRVEKWRLMLQQQKCDSVQVEISESYDPSFGVPAGAGLTLSGMNFIIGVKKGYSPISQFNTAG